MNINTIKTTIKNFYKTFKPEWAYVILEDETSITFRFDNSYEINILNVDNKYSIESSVGSITKNFISLVEPGEKYFQNEEELTEILKYIHTLWW